MKTNRTMFVLWLLAAALAAGLAAAGLLRAPAAVFWVLLGCFLLVAAAAAVWVILPMCRLEEYLTRIVQEESWERARREDGWRLLPCWQKIDAIIDGILREIQSENALQATEQQATLQALQSQINPHFLYNTLECVRGQALLDGDRDVAVMLEALGNFFRYSISRRENVVTLLDEIENIKGYMLIQNYRFSNRYQLKIEYLEDAELLLGCYVPKLMLQPLVENALLHGFENRSTGTVCVQVDASDTMLLLTVSDDGEGMSTAVLQALNDRIEGRTPPAQPQSARSNGIALPNVNRRIKMLFGKEYGLHAYSTPGRGTDMEIVLPRLTKPEVGA